MNQLDRGRRASQISDLYSSDGSWTLLTPPGRQRGSPNSSSSSSQSSLPNRINATLPFRFPESCVDRQRYFEGRGEELKSIAEILLPGATRPKPSHALRIFTISGLGGIGKTELAYRYIAEYHTEYSVLLFLTADNANRLSRSYDKLAVKLGLLSEIDKPSHEECREALKAWFKNPRQMPKSRTSALGRTPEDNNQPMLRWLLVLDNVEDWATLAPYWPEKGCGSVLLTSRKPEVLSQLVHSGSMGNLKLTVLSLPQAGHLLKHYAGYDVDHSDGVEQAAQQVSARLGNLPLAVIQVGAYIKQCQMSILDFAQVHGKEGDLHHVYLENDRVPDYQHNLASVWAVESLAQGKTPDSHNLDESPSLSNNASRQAFGLLCRIALLDAEGIPEDLLKPDPQNIASDYPTNEPEFHQRFRLLINSSLVERDPAKSEITVHRMVQQVVRAKIARDATLCQRLFDQVLHRLTMLWPYIDRIYAIGSQGHIERWPRCAALLPHITALSQANFEFRKKHLLPEPCLDFAELLYEAATYHSEVSQPEEATKLLDLVQYICRSAERSHDILEYQLRIYRGRIHVADVTKDKEAYYKYAELSWSGENQRHEQNGTKSQRLAAATLHMGIAHNFHALYEDAITFLEESANVRRALPGFRKDWLFSPLYHLAHAYFHLGRDEKAAELLKTAISDRIELLGPNDRYSMRTGALYYTLGDVRLHQGEFDESLSLHLKAYTHLKATEGPTNPCTLHCKYKVAVHYARLQDFETASAYLDEILLHYRLKPWTRMYICRAAFIYAKCLFSEGKDPLFLLEEAAQVFNEFSSSATKTATSINEEDALSLVSFDFL